MRLIDADALIDVVDGYLTDSVEEGKCIEKIMDAPTIDAVKHGVWEIYVISMFDGEGCRCSECGFEGVPYWDFCPNCGARMDGEENG